MGAQCRFRRARPRRPPARSRRCPRPNAQR
jgi:hypothetical protein